MGRLTDIAREHLDSLTVRVLFLLTLTIAPIGAIAVYQNTRLYESLSTLAEENVIAATVDAIRDQIAVAERTLGAAEAMSIATEDIWSDGERCRAEIDKVVQSADGFRFVGILTPSGLTCTVEADTDMVAAIDLPGDPFSDSDGFALTSDSDNDGATETLIASPVTQAGLLTHFVIVEATRNRFLVDQTFSEHTPEIIVMFAPSGDVLSATGPQELAQRELPADRQITLLTDGEGYVFTAENEAAEERVFSVVPVVGGLVYAMGSWTPEEANLPNGGSRLSVWIFPLVMWLATIVISYIAINRLVVRHVRKLGARMRRFSRSRRLPMLEPTSREPTEFAEINRNFLALAEGVLRDEAELEDAIRQKTLLVREVHHRVKNNLQLIASIMNMQMRKSRNSETSAIIRRLQDRVLSLAAIHRQMYRAQSLDKVPADPLVEAILSQAIPDDVDGVLVRKDLQSVELIPDQAVPLALLTAEALSNALRFADEEEDGKLRVDVVLNEQEDGNIVLEIANTSTRDGDRADGLLEFRRKGLGAQLIDAFTRQLGGTLSVKIEGGRHIIRVSFARVDFSHAVDGMDDTGAGAGGGFPAAGVAHAAK